MLGRRRVAATFAAAAVLTVVAPRAAQADVLVNAVPRGITCGDHIQVGVWYQSFSGGPHWARIAIRNSTGRTVFHRRVRATTRWRFWNYWPDCGRRYRVVYTTPGGTVGFPVRVRA
jgi:opacity protein-like surface antigen